MQFLGTRLFVSSVDISTLTDFAVVMGEIESSLVAASEEALTLDWLDKKAVENYRLNIEYLRSFYQVAERLAIDEDQTKKQATASLG